MFSAFSVFSQSKTTVKLKIVKPAERLITIVTEPKAIVWLDDLRRGTTDDKGQLKIEKVGTAAKKLRVRAFGFAEKTQILPPALNREVRVELTKTNDPAELAFQQAEALRESGREADRVKALEFYRQALKTKSNYPQALIGLARVLGDMGEIDDALAVIAAARKLHPVFPEASTVEGRIYRLNHDTDNAVKSFQRAIREAKNIQPEAHTGLALAFQDSEEMEKAAFEFRLATIQLADTEPIIYKLAGDNYVQMQRRKEAIAAYEKFLQLSPTDREAAAYRSIIEQLKKHKAGDTLEIMPQ
jgi:tetratricopeptide (TPR) repeat protein